MTYDLHAAYQHVLCERRKKKPAECIEMTVWSRWFPPGNSDFSPVLDNLQQVSHEQKFGNASLCHIFLYMCQKQIKKIETRHFDAALSI